MTESRDQGIATEKPAKRERCRMYRSEQAEELPVKDIHFAVRLEGTVS
jgi:hypothetical protein